MALINRRARWPNMRVPSRRTVATLALLGVMCIWGGALPVSKIAVAEFPPIMISLLRFGVASVLLLPLAWWQRRRVAPLSRRDLGMLAGMGLSGLALFQSAANIALLYTTATQGALVQSIIPTATALMAAVILHERLSFRSIIGIALSLVGVAAVILVAAPSANATNPLLGGMIMLGAVSLWAIYTVLSKHLVHIDALTVTAYSTLFGTLLLVPFAVIESWGQPLPNPSAAGWLSILFLGILSSALANLVYNWSLAHLHASQAANFINLVPVVAVVVAVLFLGEPLIAWQVLGGVLVVGGVWLTM